MNIFKLNANIMGSLKGTCPNFEMNIRQYNMLTKSSMRIVNTDGVVAPITEADIAAIKIANDSFLMSYNDYLALVTHVVLDLLNDRTEEVSDAETFEDINFLSILPEEYLGRVITAAYYTYNEFCKPTLDVYPGMGIKEWLASDSTGLSSQFMVTMLSDDMLTSEYEIPHDMGDFNRCVQALEAIPELKDKLKLMRLVSDKWSKLVDKWDVLESLLDVDDNQGYTLLRACIE